jgi:hypothetical protein
MKVYTPFGITELYSSMAVRYQSQFCDRYTIVRLVSRDESDLPSATVIQMKLMKVIQMNENRIVQELQERIGLSYRMSPKYQSEILFQQQIYHSRIQYRMMTIAQSKMQNHR